MTPLNKSIINLLDNLESKRASVLMTSLLFLFLISIQVVLALKTPGSVSPDETYHYTFIKFYKDFSIDPFIEDQMGVFSMGDISRITSYLYHYILSIPVRILEFGASELQFLRILNVLISILNFSLIYKLAKLITKRNISVIFSLVLVYSSYMFLFLGAFVNYDNLMITFSLLILISYLKLREKKKLKFLIYIVIFSILGSLVKYTLLPMIFLLVLLSIYQSRKQLRNLSVKKLTKLVQGNWAQILLLSFSFLLWIERYFINLIDYETIRPACDQVHEVSECLNYPIYKRAKEFKEATVEKELMNLPNYSFVWLKLMYQRTYGIFGHKSVLPLKYQIIVPLFTLLLGFASTVRLIYKKRFKKLQLDLILIVLFYILYLMLGVNYSKYLQTGIEHLAVQGRYLFPVFPLAIILITYYIENLISKRWQILLLVFITINLIFHYLLLFNNISLIWGG